MPLMVHLLFYQCGIYIARQKVAKEFPKNMNNEIQGSENRLQFRKKAQKQFSIEIGWSWASNTHGKQWPRSRKAKASYDQDISSTAS